MKHFSIFYSASLLILSFVFLIYSCSKGGGGTNPPPASPPDACAGITISFSNITTGNATCQLPATGSITVTPGGGTGPYTFKLNSGVFQSSNVFSALPGGIYSITVRDNKGCTGSGAATVNDAAAGPLFSAVRGVIQNNCVSCHNNSVSEGGMNWSVDCNMVAFKDPDKTKGG